MLPKISGYEILERLRQVPDSAITPFIFLTALLIQALARSLQNLMQEGDILARCNPDSFGLLLTQEAESSESI